MGAARVRDLFETARKQRPCIVFVDEIDAIGRKRGAELANLVNEAALTAARHGADRISSADLDVARDRMLMGIRRTSLVLSDDEKRVIAHHEAGHAVLAHLLPHADPVHKVTILPSGVGGEHATCSNSIVGRSTRSPLR